MAPSHTTTLHCRKSYFATRVACNSTQPVKVSASSAVLRLLQKVLQSLFSLAQVEQLIYSSFQECVEWLMQKASFLDTRHQSPLDAQMKHFISRVTVTR